MNIARIGYVAIQVPDVELGRHFYADVLGMFVTAEEPGRVYLRGVEEYAHHNLVLVEGPSHGLDHLGFALEHQPGDQVDWDACKAELHGLGCNVAFASNWLSGEWNEGLYGTDPFGFPVYFYRNKKQVVPWLRESHRHHGIVPLRLDHINMRVKSVDQGIAYYQALGMKLTEFVHAKSGPTKYAAWLRRRSITHDVALVEASGPVGLHHLALQVRSPEALLRCLDVLSDAGMSHQIEFGPGRHGITNALFLHVRDPFGTRVEIFVEDYQAAADFQPVEWTYSQLQSVGRNIWGPTPPESFWEMTPLLPAGEQSHSLAGGR